MNETTLSFLLIGVTVAFIKAVAAEVYWLLIAEVLLGLAGILRGYATHDVVSIGIWMFLIVFVLAMHFFMLFKNGFTTIANCINKTE